MSIQSGNSALFHNLFISRLIRAFRLTFKPSIKTAIWLVKITIPLSLLVTLLNYFGVLAHLAHWLNPAFSHFGLPGEASLVFITALFLNIYSAIAVIGQLSLSVREISIIAVMCLIAHNLIVETAVQVKTGSKAWQMVTLRISMAIVAAYLLNLIIPQNLTGVIGSKSVQQPNEFIPMLWTWALSAFRLTIKIVVLIILLMFLQQILKEFGVIKILSVLFKPVLYIFGLPQSTSFLWIVANVLGLAFGSAVMVEEIRNGTVTRKDADLLNHHIAISHSNLEDLLLFGAVGASIFWILVPRLVIAAIVVWVRRLALRIF